MSARKGLAKQCQCLCAPRMPSDHIQIPLFTNVMKGRSFQATELNELVFVSCFQAIGVPGLKGLLSVWSMWIFKLYWNHSSGLAASDWSQLPLLQRLPQFHPRRRCPPRHSFLPRKGKSEGRLQTPQSSCLLGWTPKNSILVNTLDKQQYYIQYDKKVWSFLEGRVLKLF